MTSKQVDVNSHGGLSAMAGNLGHDAWRVARRPQISPALPKVSFLAAAWSSERPRRTLGWSSASQDHALRTLGRHGTRWHPRPRGWRVCAVQRRRPLARAAFRKDAVRQRPTPRVAEAEAHQVDPRPHWAACMEGIVSFLILRESTTPAGVSNPPWTRTATARRDVLRVAHGRP